jgi:hypothetical protein
LTEHLRVFNPKIVINLSELWVWYSDPGSGKKLIPDPKPGIKKTDPGSDPQNPRLRKKIKTIRAK